MGDIKLADRGKKQSYDKTIREQLACDMIEDVTTEMDQEGIIRYFPHHEILTLNKETTKLGVVYDI
uniref:Uncharacterized protein n=1 Tax=Brugia malayi TaxID=6279 RepID=A8Q1S9_BRUMA